jgi:L-serine dehydratase
MGVFDIIGPVMIGPSSSHTAGAARLGKMAQTILGEMPVEAIIGLYGSFARTYKGHGTDKALVAGLMGFSAEDPRIKDALDLAPRFGMKVDFHLFEGGGHHPNTASFCLKGASGKVARVTGASLGGGRIAISQVDDYQVEFSGDYHALITIYQDKPGIVATVTQILARENVNIAFMRVSRKHRGDKALMILETDQPIPEKAIASIGALPVIESVRFVQPL